MSAPARPNTPTTPPPTDGEAVCTDPPIFDHVLPCSVTPFNYSQLPRQFAACIGQRERTEMHERAFIALMSDPVIQSSVLATETVRKMHDSTDGWGVVTDALGADCTTATPETEYILAALGIGVLYAPCNGMMVPLSAGMLNPVARQEQEQAPRFGPEHPYLPTDWCRIDGDAVERLQAPMLAKHETARRRSQARRASIKQLKEKMALELQAMLASSTPVESDDDPTPVPRAPHPDDFFERCL
jgi:hypothetical protein